MSQVFLALLKSVPGLFRPGLMKYLLVPPLVGCFVWVLAAIVWLGALVDWMLAETPLVWLHEWLGNWHLAWLASALGLLGAWVVLLAGAYLVVIILVGVWALPGIVTVVARDQYPDVLARGSDSFLRSAWVTARATGAYLLGWLLTLPVWLVPGMAVVHSFFWLAYLNRATFAYDALAAHASEEEWQHIKRDQNHSFWFLGLLAGGLAHVPLLGMFAPALAASAFVHLGFDALRAERGLGAAPQETSAGSGTSRGRDESGVIDGEFRRE